MIDSSGVLSFGLIWLDYLRRRTPDVAIETLALFLANGQERTTCLRLAFLDARAARFEAFGYSGENYTGKFDPRDLGNLDTHWTSAAAPRSHMLRSPICSIAYPKLSR
jgi:hypothetical protein